MPWLETLHLLGDFLSTVGMGPNEETVTNTGRP